MGASCQEDRLVKILLTQRVIALLLTLALWGCDKSSAFPTEQEVRAEIKIGMTEDALTRIFGNPTTREPEDQFGVSRLFYFAPLEKCTVQKPGYCGFQVILERRSVREWLPITGTPSYRAD
jgi:hypothetical protein